MKITNIEVLPIDRYLFVQVHTGEGIVGLGESGAWGFLKASGQVVEDFKFYLLGQDPLRIEHHWQYLYRNTHFRGAVIMGQGESFLGRKWLIGKKIKKELDKPEGISHAKMV